MAANRLELKADKTELILWTGSKYSFASLNGSGPPLWMGEETIRASDHVRLLGVTISSDLSNRQARFKYKFIVLLLTSSDSKKSPFP